MNEEDIKGQLATAKELLRTVGTDDSPGMREWDARCDAFLEGDGPNEFQRCRGLLNRAVAIITRVRDQNSPRGLDAEVEAWLRDAGRAP